MWNAERKHTLYCIIPSKCAVRLLQATQVIEKRPSFIAVISSDKISIHQTKCHDDDSPTHTQISRLAYFTCQRIPCLCIYRLKHLSLRQLRQYVHIWTVCYPTLLGVSRVPAMTVLIVDCECSYCHTHECTGTWKNPPQKNVRNLRAILTVLLLFSPPASESNQSASVMHSGFHLCPERGVTTLHERVGSRGRTSGTCWQSRDLKQAPTDDAGQEKDRSGFLWCI